MRQEHKVEGKVVSKLGTEYSTIQTLGNEQNGQPFITVQSNGNGAGKVIIHPEVLGLNIEQFKKVFSGLDILNKKKDYDNCFKETQVHFNDVSNGHSYRMVFDDLKNVLSAKNVWGHDTSREALFVNKEKAVAFAQFINANVIKSALHFKEEMPDIADKINSGFNKPGLVSKDVLKAKLSQSAITTEPTHSRKNNF